MATITRALLAIGVVLSLESGVSAGEVAPQGEPVLAQNLSGNVLWTRRPDRYTLQVLTNFRSAPIAKGTAQKPPAGAGRELPAIEVWLLKKEGAAIPAIQRWQTPASKASTVVSREFRTIAPFPQ